jgi:hypothetical protein
MSDSINIGDTVDVTGPFFETWRAEVIDVVGEDDRPTEARLLCIRPPADTGVTGIQTGQAVVLSLDHLAVAGDPDGMRATDACDDVDVTGRARPYHRHAVTGRAHAHPGGGLAHTHQPLPRRFGTWTGAPLVAQEIQVGPPDPVEIVAWIMRDHRTAYNEPGPGEVCDDDRTAARRVLAALVAGPWHLVAGQRQTGTVMHVAGGGTIAGERLLEIHQEWRP